MHNLTRVKESRAPSQMRLAASAVLVAAAIATGIVAGQANANPTGFAPPKLKHGDLRVTGTKAGERIALRLQAGEPGILQVDVTDDGSADFSFKRTDIERIAVHARPGDDVVRIDESNGVFTDTIPTTILGGHGNDNLVGGSGAETLSGGPGTDQIDGNRGNDVAFMGSGDDTFVWDPGDGSDVVEGEAGADTMLFNGPATSRWTPPASSGSTSTLSRAPTSSPSTTWPEPTSAA